ncbi:hypothetical protein [Agromyces mangrovi Wang et al. 2018]|uniref:hypothetical protein n=1 Tax=Agromyces mangrovi TaxID=1858653 RepID=UPI002572C992|nr:hypothetical protein [Agromyces mangrovi]
MAAMQHAERHPMARIADSGVRLYDIAPEHAAMGVAHLNYSRLFVAMAAEAADPEHPAHEWFLRHNAASVAILARDIRERQERGLAHPSVDATQAARQIVAVWDGLQAQWLIDPSFDIREQLTAAMNAITRANDLTPESPHESDGDPASAGN